METTPRQFKKYLPYMVNSQSANNYVQQMVSSTDARGILLPVSQRFDLIATCRTQLKAWYADDRRTHAYNLLVEQHNAELFNDLISTIESSGLVSSQVLTINNVPKTAFSDWYRGLLDTYSLMKPTVFDQHSLPDMKEILSWYIGKCDYLSGFESELTRQIELEKRKVSVRELVIRHLSILISTAYKYNVDFEPSRIANTDAMVELVYECLMAIAATNLYADMAIALELSQLTNDMSYTLSALDRLKQYNLKQPSADIRAIINEVQVVVASGVLSDIEKSVWSTTRLFTSSGRDIARDVIALLEVYRDA